MIEIRVLQESLNALKTILKEIDYQAFEKALQNKESSKLDSILIMLFKQLNLGIRCLYLVQDTKVLKKERGKVEEKWKVLTKQAQTKNPGFKEPTGTITLKLLISDVFP